MNNQNVITQGVTEMKKSYIIVTLFITLCTLAVGQERIDVIYLKNGNIVKGIIIENVPNNYVRIELQGGSILTYKYAEIEKFTKEFPTTGEVQSKDAGPTIILQQQQQQQQQQVQPAPLPQTQPSYTTDAQKMMMYDSQKKNPTTAVVLSCLLSSAGHAYAGNWGKGLLFTGGRFACAWFAVTAGIEEKTEYDPYWGYETTTIEVTGAYTLGMLGAVVIAIWEMVDASNEVKKYNKKLYNRIYLGQPNLGMKIVPTNNGTQLILAYNF